MRIQATIFAKGVIVDAVSQTCTGSISSAWRSLGTLIVCGPTPIYGFQMLGVHEKTCKFIAVFVETEEHAETDVVNAALHGSVHRFGVVIVVVFRTRRMEFMIAVFVVCFLEENVGADAGFFQFLVIFHRGRRDIHVDAADIAVFMVDGIDRLDGFEDVFDRIVDRIFSGFNGQSLVSHILQGDDFPADFLLCQLLSRQSSGCLA